MNDVELVKNILIGKTCETCGYLKIMNKLILCTKGPNDRSTLPTNSCPKWTKRREPLDLSDINALLEQLTINLGVPKGYISGRK